MKAAIFDPYLDSLGGGERYAVGVAKAFLKNGYDVFFQWKDKKILDDLKNRFGIETKEFNVLKNIDRGNGYDALFWFSDGSIPLLYSRQNFLHFQIPFQKVNGKSMINRMKFLRIKKVICNSEYTKNIIDREYGINSTVLYPPCDIASFKPLKKKNMIVYVGRFSNLTQNKNQHLLIDNFKKLVDDGLKNWKLVLIGGTEVGADIYLKNLHLLKEGYPIEIIEKPPFKVIQKYLGEAKIFWSAVGFGFDEEKEPFKMEHFGISLVEAMACACVPVVYSGGGYKEIIQNGKNGFLWKSEDELIDLTKQIIKNKYLIIQENIISSSRQYGMDEFISGFEKYLI